ncbi:superoxide dismutase family protein [bacterium]|nr:superoxide dismutase family protein [bacterium]
MNIEISVSFARFCFSCFFLSAVFGTSVVLAEDSGAGERITARAVLFSKNGSRAQGTVQFREVQKGVEVSAQVMGLSEGKHGFHVHQYGDCSSEDASSAGGHFSAKPQQHGPRDQPHRHTGDMGNLVADKQGKAHLTYVDRYLSLSGESSILGRAVIVHMDPDTYVQPSGNAGARIACGVIGRAKTTAR